MMNAVPVLTRGAETIRDVLRMARHKKGLTIDELAEQARMSKPYLSLIETSRFTGKMNDGIIERLCAVLGLDADEWIAKEYLARIPKKHWEMIGLLVADEQER
jgi:transcriptional regulator with XRE-family HTH domain